MFIECCCHVNSKGNKKHESSLGGLV